MPYELSDEERERVHAGTDEQKYRYFVDRGAGSGQVFTLADGDRWASVDSGGDRYLPVWPHPGFAEECLTGAWADFEANAIQVRSFLDVLENLIDMGDRVALFRRADGDFIMIDPRVLLEDLVEALEG